MSWHLPFSALFVCLFNLFYFIFGCAGSSCCTGFSLVAESRGYSLVEAHELLTSLASLVCLSTCSRA